MADDNHFKVEVAYALPSQQVILSLEIKPETTIEEAIQLSGILEQYPEIDLAKTKVGVFGKLSKLKATLRAGDRIEIYRPLIADPKEVRRQRAAQGKVMKRGAAAANEATTEEADADAKESKG